MSANKKPRRIFCEDCAHFRVLGSFSKSVMPCAKKKRQRYVYPERMGDPHGLVPEDARAKCFERRECKA